MILTKSGWLLSPAFDLLNVTMVNPSDKEEFALTSGGKKKKIKLEYFRTFGQGLGLTIKQITVYSKGLLTKNGFQKNGLIVHFYLKK